MFFEGRNAKADPFVGRDNCFENFAPARIEQTDQSHTLDGRSVRRLATAMKVAHQVKLRLIVKVGPYLPERTFAARQTMCASG